ncbi:hypothetical protein [Rhizobium binae]|uniref:hypothetical protein n=1 Tax=Rhizobium binae TaxID=1138190 RepID=UPI001FECC54F|nr:hypothetical protein [Rhizobium binae]
MNIPPHPQRRWRQGDAEEIGPSSEDKPNDQIPKILVKRGRVNKQATSTSIKPSSLFVTDGVEVDDAEISIHGKRTVLERLVMTGERLVASGGFR